MNPPALPSRRLLLPVLGLLLAGLPFGCRRAAPPADEGGDKPPPAPVKIESARQFAVGEWSELLGTTQPLLGHVARVTAPVEGRVQKIFVQDAAGKALAEGHEVHEKDPILQLDDRIIQQQKVQAEADRKLAEHEVNKLEALVGTGASTSQPLVSRYELIKARLALESANSKHKGLEEQVKLFTLCAPIDGRLGRIQVVPGQTLAVGTTVADVIDIRAEIEVLCFVPPHIARRLKVNEQPAHLLRGGEEAATAKIDPEGKIVFIAEQAEPDTGNFAVKVRFPNRELQLRANVVARVRVLTTAEKPALTIPEAALLMDQDPPRVVIVEDLKTEKLEGKDVQMGKARRLQAKVGIRDPVLHQVEILGLEDPEKPKDHFSVEEVSFVVEGAQGLRTGDTVKVEQEEEEAGPGERGASAP